MVCQPPVVQRAQRISTGCDAKRNDPFASFLPEIVYFCKPKFCKMEYDFRAIEKKWQEKWAKEGTYRVKEDASRPKYYVLNMFPYPSGAGLHVGHPLGYIASDIYARYKRQCGFNVLNPMGYDAYGLPAEQYAIQTGQHPAITTENNINRYREQLDKIGFSFDWDRRLLPLDPVGIPEDVQQFLLQQVPERPAH